ncbi:hypothetical protein MYSI104531_23705 [Mycobacterium simiae]
MVSTPNDSWPHANRPRRGLAHRARGSPPTGANRCSCSTTRSRAVCTVSICVPSPTRPSRPWRGCTTTTVSGSIYSTTGSPTSCCCGSPTSCATSTCGPTTSCWTVTAPTTSCGTSRTPTPRGAVPQVLSISRSSTRSVPPTRNIDSRRAATPTLSTGKPSCAGLPAAPICRAGNDRWPRATPWFANSPAHPPTTAAGNSTSHGSSRQWLYFSRKRPASRLSRCRFRYRPAPQRR